MSEEEKEAIKELKKYKDWNCYYNTGYLYKAVSLDNKYQQAIQTGLNYIDKLQKENEDMREELQMYVDTDVMKLQEENKHLKEQLLISNSLDNMYNLYISKDKIIDKIKELEEELQYEITKNEAKLQIDLLNQLLEEE